MGFPTGATFPLPIEWIDIPKENYGSRDGQLPIGVAIHIAEGSKQSVIFTFKDPLVQKSCHFLVCRDGSVVQFVATKNASFCTGNIDNPVNALVLTSKENPNKWTVSIEHEGFSNQDITERQYETSAVICKYLADKWGILLDRTHIFGHREVFSLKTCPGMINVDKIIQKARKI